MILVTGYRDALHDCLVSGLKAVAFKEGCFQSPTQYMQKQLNRAVEAIGLEAAEGLKNHWNDAQQLKC